MNFNESNKRHDPQTNHLAKSKLEYDAPIITILGDALQLTKGSENAPLCDGNRPGKGELPCAS